MMNEQGAPPAPPQWHPMDTMPSEFKDGRKVLLFHCDWEQPIVGWWTMFYPLKRECWCDHEGALSETDYEPTHFLPLPAPPANGEEK